MIDQDELEAELNRIRVLLDQASWALQGTPREEGSALELPETLVHVAHELTARMCAEIAALPAHNKGRAA